MLPMNFENGIAAMNWPNVPLAVLAYVRLAANVRRLDEFSGRISSEPKPVSFGLPLAP